jgi:hypothetical protein
MHFLRLITFLFFFFLRPSAVGADGSCLAMARLWGINLHKAVAVAAAAEATEAERNEIFSPFGGQKTLKAPFSRFQPDLSFLHRAIRVHFLSLMFCALCAYLRVI